MFHFRRRALAHGGVSGWGVNGSGEKGASPLGAKAYAQGDSGEPELQSASRGIGQDEGRFGTSHPDEACGGEDAPFRVEREERIGVGLSEPEV